MPVHRVPGGGFQYGSSGKVYRGPGAAHKAFAQAAAIEHSGYREGKTRRAAKTLGVKAAPRLSSPA